MFGCIPRPLFSGGNLPNADCLEGSTVFQGVIKKNKFFPAKNSNQIPRFPMPNSSHYVD
jgi:hypothetical protein